MPEVTKKILQWKEILFTITAVVVAALNLWLGAKLYPLGEGIRNNSKSIDALAAEVNRNKDDADCVRDELYCELKYIRNRVDQLYSLAR